MRDRRRRSGPIRSVATSASALAPGETLAIVGESGSGKTLTGARGDGAAAGRGRAGRGQHPAAGRDGACATCCACPKPTLRALRGRDIAMVFQDPIEQPQPGACASATRSRESAPRASASRDGVRDRVVALLRRVGICPIRNARASAYPHELSGGQRQRVMIAMAIANQPAPADRRRADHRARRHRAGADPRRCCAELQARRRHGHGLRHAQPRAWSRRSPTASS